MEASMLPPLGGIVDRPVATRKGMRTNFLCILFTVGLYYFCSMFFHILLGLNVFVLGSIATLEVGLISIVETFLLSIATLRITSLNLFYFISIHVSLLFSAAQIKSTLIEYILFLFL
ncbi:hypothetical protein ACJX0J_019250, partial [Zea mays]